MNEKITIFTLLFCFIAGINTNAQTIDIPEDLSGEVWKIMHPNPEVEQITYAFLENGSYEMSHWYNGGLYYSENIKGTYHFNKQANEIYFNADSIWRNGKPQAINQDIKREHSNSFKILQQENDSIYSIQKFTSKDDGRNGKRVTTKEVYPAPKMQRIKSNKQKINALLQKLNSWVLDETGAYDTDAYERPYAYPNYIPSGETNAWVSGFKNQLCQLGATVIWNEKKKLYELETNQHLIARRAFVEVYVAKTLYQSEKAPAEYFLKITVKNTGTEKIGFKLSHQDNNIFFANQWGKYTKPFRGVIDERRIVFKNENLSPIIQQLKDGLLQTIKLNEQLDYYINLDGSNNKLILDDKSGFFIVIIDGQMKFTDGKTVELISLANEEDETRAIVFPLPATIETVPEKQWMFIDKVMNEHRH